MPPRKAERLDDLFGRAIAKMRATEGPRGFLPPDPGDPPNMRQITARDLEDDGRLGILYIQFVKRGRWSNSVHDVLDFASFAALALARGRRGDPGSLFSTLVEKKDRRIITDGIEQRALRRFPSWAQADLVEAAAAALVRPEAVAPYLPVRRATLPGFGRISDRSALLPAFVADDIGEPQRPQLPGFASVPACASWLLDLYDRAGGRSMRQGRGAPWDLRLFVYALLHLHVSDRDGLWRTIDVPHLPDHAKRLEDATGERRLSVSEWLHGPKWSNARRDWHLLPEALDRLAGGLGRVYLPGVGDVLIVTASAIPRSRTDPVVQFSVRIPGAAAHGDRIDWPTLTEYGRQSAVLFRAYLSAVAWMGKSARYGMPLTAEIPQAVRYAGGRPKRRQGGRIVRSGNLEPNPLARFVGALCEHDLTAMIGFDPQSRDHRRQARAAWRRLHDDGVIDLRVEAGGRFRIFGPPVGQR